MHLKRYIAKACIGVGALTALSAPGAAAPLTLDDVFRTVSIDLVDASPDGRDLAVVIQRPVGPDEVFGRASYETDPSRNDVWLVSRDGRAKRNLTNGQSLASGSWCAHWSPDGQKLAYLSTWPEGDEPRGGNAVRLYVWDRSTDTTRRLSPRAMMTQTRYGSGLDALDLRRDGASQDGPAVCLRHNENAPFVWLDARHVLVVQMPEGENSALFTHFRRSAAYNTAADVLLATGKVSTVDVSDTDPAIHARLSVRWMADVAIIDVATGDRRLLATVPAFPFFGMLSLVVSPDGRQIAVLASAEAIALDRRLETQLDDTSVKKRLGLIAIDQAAQIRWIDMPADAALPLDLLQWSADGRKLAFRARASGGSDKAGVFVLTPATRAVAALGAGLKTVLWQVGTEPHALPAIWAGNRTMLVSAIRDGQTGTPQWWSITPGKSPVLAALPPLEGDARPAGLPADAEVLVRDAHGLIWHEQTPHGEFLRETASDQAKPATIMTLNEHLAGVDWGKTEYIDYATTKGAAVKALVILPPGYVPGRKYPLLVWQYPSYTVTGKDEYWADPYLPGIYNLQLYAARGYIVLVPSIPISREPGPNAPYRQMTDGVLPAIDKLVASGQVDPARIGVFGQSYGGYGAYALVTQTDRFAAAVAIAGLPDLTAAYGVFERDSEGWTGIAADKSANPQILYSAMRFHANPVDSPAFYLENSPIIYVSQVHTPLLIAHGTLDERGDIGEAQAFFTGLARQGKPARLLSYAGEGHAISLSPANVRNLFCEINAWFDKWLGDSVINRH